jgi:hypothetical protein
MTDKTATSPISEGDSDVEKAVTPAVNPVPGEESGSGILTDAEARDAADALDPLEMFSDFDGNYKLMLSS